MLNKDLFHFLVDLKANNRRDWFADNKQRYEESVRQPLLAFVESFAPHLKAISPYFVASPKALFRIHRDVRFSHDKSPYKTNVGVQFRHENGKDAHTPGFYLHLDPDECFLGSGIWHPDSASLQAIRERLVHQPKAWQEVSQIPGHTLAGESLKKAPKGFDPEHPLLEDLKRKDHVAFRPLTQEEILAPDFLETYAGHCRAAASYVRFLAEALGQPF